MEEFSENGSLGESEDLSGLVPEFVGESVTSGAVEFVEDISAALPGVEESEEEEDGVTEEPASEVESGVQPEVKKDRVGFVYTDIPTPGVSVYGK